MTAATRTRLDVVLLTRHIGAEIRGIDLREEGRRHLHIIDATPDNGCCKPGQIADNAAAEGDDQISPLYAGRDHLLANLFQHRKALRAFA